MLTLYSTAWGGPGDRFINFSAPGYQRTIDQDVFGGRNGITINYPYTADASGKLTVQMAPLNGNNTFHWYGFANRQAEATQSYKWNYSAWNDDASCGVDSSYAYTHAFNFGTANNVSVNGVVFAGVAGGNPGRYGLFQVAGVGGAYANSPYDDVTGASRGLANDFAYGGNPGFLTLNGLTPGKEYLLTLYGVAFGSAPRGAIFSCGTDQRYIPEGEYGSNKGILMTYRYTADSSGSLTVSNTPVVGTDTIHLHGFSNRGTTPGTDIPSGWSYGMWINDATAGVDSTRHFTHAYNFGTWIDAAINGIPFTAVAGANPAVPGKFSTVGFPSVVNNDANNVTGGSRQLANDFAYGADQEVLTIQGLTPGKEYVTTLYAVAWGDPDAVSRWITFGAANGQASFNQNWYGDNNGIRISYRFTADGSGSVSLTNQAQTTAVTLHLCGFATYETAVAEPFVNAQPRSTWATPGQNVTLSVLAVGAPTLYYQWTKNGTNLTGQTSASLLLPTVALADAGAYAVVITNSVGSVTSAIATVEVGVELVNPSFEVDAFTAQPGYISSGNFPITGWAVSAPAAMGLNPAGGASPFADNGTVPNGSQVAFMQSDGTLSQVVTGLTPDVAYYVKFYENARSGPTPSCTVTMDGVTVVPTHNVPSGQYQAVSSAQFLATSSSMTLAFVKGSPFGGDNTLLLDQVAVIAIPGVVPVITNQPQSQTIAAGSTLTLTSGASGTIPLHYQWQFNEANLLNRTNAAFVLVSANTNDAGNYRVIVTNPYGSATSDVAVVTVIGYPPGIVTQPRSQYVAVGDNVALTTVVTGAPPLYFQWYKDNNLLSGENNASLVMNPIAANQAGSYQLVVTNYLGSATSTLAVLKVGERIPGLFNTGVDSNGVVVDDGSADLHYRLVYSDDPAYPGPQAVVMTNGAWPVIPGTYMTNGPSSAWISPGINGTPNAVGNYAYQTTFNLATLDPATARITGGWASDNGGFAILLNGTDLGITNPNGFWSFTSFEITNGFRVGANTLTFVVHNDGPPGPTALRVELSGVAMPYVQAPPQIASQPTNTTVMEGQNVSFGVVAFGSGPLSYQWYVADLNLALPGETNSVFTYPGVVRDASGASFLVVISNAYGSITSAPAMLTVVVSPSVLTPLEPQTVECGSDVTFALDIDGDAPLHYLLYAGASFVSESIDTVPVLSGVSLAQSGEYTVVVTNVWGGATSGPVLLTVQDTTPPDITCPAAIIVTNTTGGGEIVSFALPTAWDTCGLPNVICLPPSGSSFASGITRVDCSATDGGNNSVQCHFNVEVRTLLVVTGHVALEAFVGPARDGHGSRAVVFMATDNATNVLAAWTNTLTFVPGANGYGVAGFTVVNVPVGTTHLSAKTAWNLRKRLAATFTDNAAAVEFTGDSELPGGDIHGANNLVDVDDYFQLAAAWYQANGAADLDGDGVVDVDDYFILASHWYQFGDAP